MAAAVKFPTRNISSKQFLLFFQGNHCFHGIFDGKPCVREEKVSSQKFHKKIKKMLWKKIKIQTILTSTCLAEVTTYLTFNHSWTQGRINQQETVREFQKFNNFFCPFCQFDNVKETNCYCLPPRITILLNDKLLNLVLNPILQNFSRLLDEHLE